jgi:hypothetical protein
MIMKPKTMPELRFLFSSAKSATYRSLGQRPRYRTPPKPQALKGRPNSLAPTGQTIVAQGNALGNLATISQALKGRPNSQRMEVAP